MFLGPSKCSPKNKIAPATESPVRVMSWQIRLRRPKYFGRIFDGMSAATHAAHAGPAPMAAPQ